MKKRSEINQQLMRKLYQLQDRFSDRFLVDLSAAEFPKNNNANWRCGCQNKLDVSICRDGKISGIIIIANPPNLRFGSSISDLIF